MTNGVSRLNYNLYTKANRNQVWGNGSGGTQLSKQNCVLGGSGASHTSTETVYGGNFAG